MKRTELAKTTFLALAAISLSAQSKQEINSVFNDARDLYLDIHQNPELSSHETRTAAKMAEKLRALGYQVTEHVGGEGIVAIMKNGAGPVIMLRTELDALPVEEKTGLPYASKVHAKDDTGREVGVMHACGHDMHMASLYGTAAIMAHSKDTWHGTLMFIGQPAEETIAGAKRMIEDGFITRFPKPDFGIALHTGNDLPAGKIGWKAGYWTSSADSIRITIHGKGGHGALPETAIDPIVIASRVVLTLQTITSREVKPGEPAVVTVGYFHAGTKNNIIPDDAQLGLTVRTFNPAVRQHILDAIARIVKAEAAAAGATKEPEIDRYEGTAAVYNEPSLGQRLRAPLENTLGKENIVENPASMASEDYSYFIAQGIRSFCISLGAGDPEKMARGEKLPSNHSPLYAPDLEPTLRTGIATEVTVLRTLLR